ncbi:hypothetical protein M3Y96_00381700 [Aphelenchoides besseyi]|nr:hypothetical protein M3Y96_00381700 [Aphelenchoides besseyi]
MERNADNPYMQLIPIPCFDLFTRVKMGQGTELLALTGIVAMLPYDMQCQSISFQANAAFLSATILVAQYYYRFRLVTTRTPPSNKDATIYFFCSVLMATVSGLTASYTFCNRAECKLNTNFASLWFRESPIPQLMVASSCDSTMFLYMAVSTSTVVGSYLTIVVLNRLTTVMPFFLSIAPMSGILIMSLTKVDTSQAGNLLMMTISWIPVFNPLLSLIVIS